MKFLQSKRPVFQSPLFVALFVGALHVALLAYFLIHHQVGPEILDNPVGQDMRYDGYYFREIAVNPLAAAPNLDLPAFRYQRIIYPMLARALALGNPVVIDWTLLFISLASVIAGTWLLAKLLQEWQCSAWYAAIYGLFVGQFVVVRFDTSESLTYLLVLLAITMYERSRYRLMAVFFALSILTKELAVLFWLGYMVYWVYQRKWRLVALLGSAIIPYLLWQVVLYFWLGSFGFAAGGASLSLLPFAGYLTRSFQPAMALFPLILILPALLCLGSGFFHMVRYGITALGIAMILNALLIVFMPEESTGEIRAVGRMALGLVLAATLFWGKTRQYRGLNYAILWIPLSTIYLISLFG